jgi:hypothetical protein
MTLHISIQLALATEYYDPRDMLAEVLRLKVSYEAAYFSKVIEVSAVTDRTTYLVVNCSGHQGYVQTPGWDKLSTYDGYMDLCVTLHTPPGHVTLLSLVSLDLEIWRSRCQDKLFIFPGTCDDQDLNSDDNTVII